MSIDSWLDGLCIWCLKNKQKLVKSDPQGLSCRADSCWLVLLTLQWEAHYFKFSSWYYKNNLFTSYFLRIPYLVYINYLIIFQKDVCFQLKWCIFCAEWKCLKYVYNKKTRVCVFKVFFGFYCHHLYLASQKSLPFLLPKCS